jgi:hypothetical protein
MSDEELFVGYEVSTGVIPTFFIESTAPVNIDDRDGKVLPTPDFCVRLPSVEDAVEKITTTLLDQKEPKLVITVHGFNNPRESVLKYYTIPFSWTVTTRSGIGASCAWAIAGHPNTWELLGVAAFRPRRCFSSASS